MHVRYSPMPRYHFNRNVPSSIKIQYGDHWPFCWESSTIQNTHGRHLLWKSNKNYKSWVCFSEKMSKNYQSVRGRVDQLTFNQWTLSADGLTDFCNRFFLWIVWPVAFITCAYLQQLLVTYFQRYLSQLCPMFTI